jgi:glycosyltransferase involved in cell wall biosynthesis
VRVLVQIRPNAAERDGGDTLHAERKAEEMRALGHEVDVSGALVHDPSPYDVVHLYNTAAWMEATFGRALRAHGCGVPVVIEPIYWDSELFYPEVTYRQHEGLRHVAFAVADRLLPNSSSEAAALESRFPAVEGRVRVVPVGVDSPQAGVEGSAAAFCGRYGVEPGFVLCAGRKELRKNQLRLIRACGAAGLPLVLAGGEHAENAEYVAECREAAASSPADVRFLPHLGAEDLAGAYSAAAVHAQPSIWETVGLTSLEAALAGCRVVTTSASGIADYLGADAWYCDPLSEGSIRDALVAANAAEPREGLGARLRSEFTWRRAAELTVVAYREAMEEHAQRQGRPPIPVGQYVAHLEELVQLQLEAIAFRDEILEGMHDYAENLKAEVERTQALEQDLEAELERAKLLEGELEGEVVVTLERTQRLEGDLARSRDELARARADLAAAEEHLQRLSHTKLLRLTRPVRDLYGRLRG